MAGCRVCLPHCSLLRAGYGYVPYSRWKALSSRTRTAITSHCAAPSKPSARRSRTGKPGWCFFLKTMAKQKDNLAAKVKEEQALRSSLPALSRQILELAKTRDEITVKEIEDTTGANRNTIKVHVKKLAEQHYLLQVGKGAAHATPSNRRLDGYPGVLRIATLELFHCW